MLGILQHGKDQALTENWGQANAQTGTKESANKKWKKLCFNISLFSQKTVVKADL